MTCAGCSRLLYAKEQGRGTCGRCNSGRARRERNLRRRSARSLAARVEADALREQQAARDADAAAVLARRDRYRTVPVETPERDAVAVPVHGRDPSAWLFGGSK